MELRRLSLYLALFVLAICSQSCSDAHTMHKRGTDDNYDDTLMGDEGTDDEAQNDAEGLDADDDVLPEKIITEPTNYNVTVGKTIRLACKVEPNNSPVIQWLKDGEPLFMGKSTMKKVVDPRLKIATDVADHDLFIKDLRPSDNGKYVCKVMQLEPIAMVEHRLLVLEAPRIVSFTATDNGTVMEGEDLLLTCNVTGSPPPEVVWSFVADNDKNLQNTRLTETDATFTLNTAFIRNIKHHQAGKYYCYAFQGRMDDSISTQSELAVRVLHKPRVHVHKTVVNSAPGIEAILQCTAHGDPAPQINWYKDGHIIDSLSTQFTITTEGLHSTLTVTPKEDADFGTFTCEARNTHGNHSNSIELVQRPLVEGLDLEGNKLTWKVQSHQPLERVEVQLRDTQGTMTTINVPVPEKAGHEYDMTYVLNEVEQGTYDVIVKAKNTKEWSTASESMVLDYNAPLPIQTASVYHGNSHSIRPGTSVVLSTVFMYLLMRLF